MSDWFKNVYVNCPNCGMPSEFTQQNWSDYCTPEHVLVRRKKPPEIPAQIECRTCHISPTLREWQRSHERAEFKRLKWTTPSMEKSA